MDLEGLDFTTTTTTCSNSSSDKMSVSSTAEEPSSDKQKQVYPDYSHVFNEIRRNQNGSYVPQLNPCFPQAQTGAFGLNYGWNMSYLSGNQQQKASDIHKSQHSTYQSTFRSNWTYQSPRPAYNVWGYDHKLIIPTATPPKLQGSLTQVASNSDFDSLRNEPETVEESADVFPDDLTSQGKFEEKQTRSRTSSDLMEFEEPEEKEYMSLDSFDPLYSRTRRESIIFRRNSISEEGERTDSIGSGFDFSELERPQSGLYPSLQKETEDSKSSSERSSASIQSESLSSADALEQFFRSSHVEVEEEIKPDIPERPPLPVPRASANEVVMIRF